VRKSDQGQPERKTNLDPQNKREKGGKEDAGSKIVKGHGLLSNGD